MASNPSNYYNADSLLPGWTTGPPGRMCSSYLTHNLRYLKQGDDGEIPMEKRFTFIPTENAQTPQILPPNPNTMASASSNSSVGECLNYPTISPTYQA
jgi:hypothetical protein